jgi:6-phosphogluconolactonase (cycloisomerase 2 family)
MDRPTAGKTRSIDVESSPIETVCAGGVVHGRLELLASLPGAPTATPAPTPVPAKPFVVVPDNGTAIVTLAPATNGTLTVTQRKTVASVGAYASGHPSKNWVYAIADSGTNIRSYVIASDGTLTEMASSPIATSVNSHEHLLIEPLGRFLYSTDGSTGHVDGFKINQTTGALTAITSAGTCGVDCFATMQATDSLGKYLYVAAQGSDGTTNGIYSFTIDQTTGAVTAMSSSPYLLSSEGNGPYGLIVSGDGKYLVSGNTGNSANVGGLVAGFSSFAINATNGHLTYVGSITAGVYPLQMSTDSSGNIYSSDAVAGKTVHVSLNSSGLPTAVTQMGAGGFGCLVDPTGHFIYGANSTLLSQFSLSGVVATPLTPAAVSFTNAYGIGWASYR